MNTSLPHTTYTIPQDISQFICYISLLTNILQILYVQHVSGIAFNKAIYQQLNLTPADRQIDEPQLDRIPRNIFRQKV